MLEERSSDAIFHPGHERVDARMCFCHHLGATWERQKDRKTERQKDRKKEKKRKKETTATWETTLKYLRNLNERAAKQLSIGILCHKDNLKNILYIRQYFLYIHIQYVLPISLNNIFLFNKMLYILHNK